MASWKILAVGALVAAGAVACGPGSMDTDTGSGSDASMMDTGGGGGDTGGGGGDTGTRDTGGGGGDTGMMGGDSGGGAGTCGTAVHTCLCGCPMGDAMCQQGCLGMSTACTQCYGRGIATCCPTEAMAVQTCFQNAAMPGADGGAACAMTDQPCLIRTCMTQYTALQTCFMREQMSTPTCMNALATCFGAYPFTCP